jgi:hypothetical protein
MAVRNREIDQEWVERDNETGVEMKNKPATFDGLKTKGQRNRMARHKVLQDQLALIKDYKKFEQQFNVNVNKMIRDTLDKEKGF